MSRTPSLKELRYELTVMGEMIEQNVDTALMALVDRNLEMAQEVIRLDEAVDEMENTIDQACQDLLRSKHISAKEFRFVVSSMKICVHLERMSDLAVDISCSVSFLITRRSILSTNVFSPLIETVEQMVRDGVSCLMSGNVEQAWRICLIDDVADAETQRLHDYLISVAQDEPEKTERAVHLLYVVRALERIGDQATNIAEEVIFMLEGKIVRHHIDEHRQHIEPPHRSPPSKAKAATRVQKTASRKKTSRRAATRTSKKSRR